MKLRLRENSIRLRLQISEIAQLRETGLVTESIQFPNMQALTYSIRIDEKANEMSSSFENGKVSVSVPKETAKQWLETEEVGVETLQVINEDLSLNILLEKDFKCLTERANEVDMFPNPEEVHV